MVCAKGLVRWRDEANRGDAVLGTEGKKGKEREGGWRQRRKRGDAVLE